MIKEIKPKNNKQYSGHEKVFYFEDKKVGLRGYVAWHNTVGGPATGGTRLYDYKKTSDALSDVLRLSKAMTYKGVISGVPFGGGKAVIIGIPAQKTKEFLKSYAKVIDSFKGKFTTGTDVGISDDDTKYMSSITPFILKGTGGRTTTSLMAARGVYEGVVSAFRTLFPHKKIQDMTIAIKGTGKIGAELIRLLYKHNVKIIAGEKDAENIKKIKKLFPKIKVVDYKNIHKVKVDVYSPCAMGGELTPRTIRELNCRIIVGGANNQFVDERDISKLTKRGIWYVPDYVVNAGGLIQIVDELRRGGYNTKRVRRGIKNIGNITRHLIQESEKTGISTIDIAKKIVHEKIYKK
ncbi:MAG: Glu/Leu/Phe/Val dehydrogenase dimerization domain-containing protein [Candidatus Paceibacterota bacterium]|jgi:glutamate dehydrogenase/leucine dehydrogenase